MKRRMLAFVISLLLLLPYGFCLPLADTAASLAAAVVILSRGRKRK